MPRKVAILIFDEVEVLDFTGPFEVFAVTRDQKTDEPLFEVYTVAEKAAPVRARNGLSVNPNYTLGDAPEPDIIVVPGGHGVREVIDNPAVIDWITAQAARSDLVLSVCTGAWLLGQAGILKGLSATTYHTAFERLQQIEPTVTLRPGERWVDNGRVVTSAGVSAGIDMALHVVAKLHGDSQALHTAEHMEYEHWPRASE
jgi:transcriptional regulator GlxA family with amidase domain